MSESTIGKALAILDLFEGDQVEWTNDEIAQQLVIPASTSYRYLRELANRGYIVSSRENAYTLGPKITLLSHHLRLKDPVIAACREHAENLARDFPGSVMINRVFKQSFICIYSIYSKDEARASFNPGDAMPLLDGANAQVIQAFLSRHLQIKLFEANSAYFAAKGRGTTYKEFRRKLQDVRARRVAKVAGAVRVDSVGVAAPLLGLKDNILGTISFSFAIGQLNVVREADLLERVRAVGLEASETLQRR